MSNKYVDFEYLKQNNPNPTGIQFKGLFGDRSLGKTHGVIKYLTDTLPENQALMILRRNALELNFEPFAKKYGAAFGKDWTINGKTMVENHDRIISYLNCLSLSERGKHDNYDAPYITNIVVDEAFAEKPNKGEFKQLQTWIGTVARRTGFPFHPVTVWLLGNDTYGHSPILEELGIYKSNGKKQKTSNGVYLFSDKQSPDNVINVKSPLIRNFDIFPDNPPVLNWMFKNHSYGLFDVGHHLYIKKIDRAKQPYDFEVKRDMIRLALRKVGIPRIYVEDYDCLRFLDEPALRITM